MPHNHEWQTRIKAVEREYVAMRQAADRFRQAAMDDPTILVESLRHNEIVMASRNRGSGRFFVRGVCRQTRGLRHQKPGAYANRNPGLTPPGYTMSPRVGLGEILGPRRLSSNPQPAPSETRGSRHRASAPVIASN
jgi:hypothetical protein